MRQCTDCILVLKTKFGSCFEVLIVGGDTVGIAKVMIIRESWVLKMDYNENIVICKCEDIALDEIKNAIKNGAKDINSIKRITRAGMGCCQGHVCETIIQKILTDDGANIDDIRLLLRRNPPLVNITLKGIASLNG